MTVRDIDERAAALRRAFDETFAAAPHEAATPTDAFLAVRVAGDPFAIRLSEIALIAATPRIVAVPSRNPAALGVAGLRGSLVAVYSLARLLGYDGGRASHRWIAVAAGVDAVALAFDEIDAFVRAPRDAGGAFDDAGVTRAVVDVASLVTSISTGAPGSA